MYSKPERYPIFENSEDILAMLAEEMQIIPHYENSDIKIYFHAQRVGNCIEARGTIYEVNGASVNMHVLFDNNIEGFSFEVRRRTDKKSLVIGKFARAQTGRILFIEKLYYTQLEKLGAQFDTEWKKEVSEKLKVIKAEIDKKVTWGEIESGVAEGDEHAIELKKKWSENLRTIVGDMAKVFEQFEKSLFTPLELAVYETFVKNDPNAHALLKGDITMGELIEMFPDIVRAQAMRNPVAIDLVAIKGNRTKQDPENLSGLPKIEDPTNQKLWEILQKDLSISDDDLAKKMTHVSEGKLQTEEEISSAA